MNSVLQACSYHLSNLFLVILVILHSYIVVITNKTFYQFQFMVISVVHLLSQHLTDVKGVQMCILWEIE